MKNLYKSAVKYLQNIFRPIDVIYRAFFLIFVTDMGIALFEKSSGLINTFKETVILFLSLFGIFLLLMFTIRIVFDYRKQIYPSQIRLNISVIALFLMVIAFILTVPLLRYRQKTFTEKTILYENITNKTDIASRIINPDNADPEIIKNVSESFSNYYVTHTEQLTATNVNRFVWERNRTQPFPELEFLAFLYQNPINKNDLNEEFSNYRIQLLSTTNMTNHFNQSKMDSILPSLPEDKRQSLLGLIEITTNGTDITYFVPITNYTEFAAIMIMAPVTNEWNDLRKLFMHTIYVRYQAGYSDRDEFALRYPNLVRRYDSLIYPKALNFVEAVDSSQIPKQTESFMENAVLSNRILSSNSFNTNLKYSELLSNRLLQIEEYDSPKSFFDAEFFAYLNDYRNDEQADLYYEFLLEISDETSNLQITELVDYGFAYIEKIVSAEETPYRLLLPNLLNLFFLFGMFGYFILNAYHHRDKYPLMLEPAIATAYIIAAVLMILKIDFYQWWFDHYLWTLVIRLLMIVLITLGSIYYSGQIKRVTKQNSQTNSDQEDKS